MAKKCIDLKIPYGIMDFRRLRREGYYYVDKTEYLAQMEARDSFIVQYRGPKMCNCELVGEKRY